MQPKVAQEGNYKLNIAHNTNSAVWRYHGTRSPESFQGLSGFFLFVFFANTTTRIFLHLIHNAIMSEKNVNREVRAMLHETMSGSELLMIGLCRNVAEQNTYVRLA